MYLLTVRAGSASFGNQRPQPQQWQLQAGLVQQPQGLGGATGRAGPQSDPAVLIARSKMHINLPPGGAQASRSVRLTGDLFGRNAAGTGEASQGGGR